MTTYNTYEECKINHPEDNIYHSDGSGFAPGSKPQRFGFWTICNPADHCMSLEAFFEAGHEFVVGDFFIGVSGFVVFVKEGNEHAVNKRYDSDNKCFVLSAKALEDNAEQVEWKNGDECLVEKDENQLLKGRYICFDEYECLHVCQVDLGIYHVADHELSRPETPEQKEEREEKEEFIKKAREVISGTTETNTAIEKMFEAGMRFK